MSIVNNNFMNTLDAIKTRRSIRKFKNTLVPKSELEKIMQSAIWAPSSMNKQPWRFVVATKSETMKMLSDIAKAELKKFLQTEEAKKKYGDAVGRFMKRAENSDDVIFYNAPALIVVLQTQEAANGQFDHGMAAMNIMLAAHELGLGTVPVGLGVFITNSPEARKILKMRDNDKIIITIPVGYPDETPSPTERDFGAVEWI
jgi:nitroreductase